MCWSPPWTRPATLADPFHRAAHLTPDDARSLFARLHGERVGWDDSYLDPVGRREVVARILANLANRYRADRRHRSEAVALGLRSMVPGVARAEQSALASALARSGAFDRAAVHHGGPGRRRRGRHRPRRPAAPRRPLAGPPQLSSASALDRPVK